MSELRGGRGRGFELKSIWYQCRTQCCSVLQIARKRDWPRTHRMARRFADRARRLQKFIREDPSVPLMFMYFLMLMVNTLLRDTKDTLLVMSPAGVESIPVLKTWAVIPASMAYFYGYSRLSKKFSKQTCFQVVLYSFTFFYVVFALVLYPMKHLLSPTATAKHLRTLLPENFHALTRLWEEWLAAVFFIVSELWSSGVCQLMFWQVANDVMTVHQARSLYPFIGLLGNVGMFFAGIVLKVMADHRDVVSANAYLRIPHGKKKLGKLFNRTSATRLAKAGREMSSSLDSVTKLIGLNFGVGFDFQQAPMEQAWRQTLFGISFILLTFTLINILLYKSVFRRKIMHAFPEDLESLKKKEEKPKMSIPLWKSLRTLSASKPLRCTAVLVIAYGISSCLVEVCWKGQVKTSYVATNDYSRFMASFWTYTGIMSMIFMFAGRVVLQHLGYRTAVMFTPILVFASGAVFFIVSITQDPKSSVPYAAYSGAFLVMMAKSAKYAFFDSTKEMIFIPLDKESKTVGKAAIELVAYRMAKSGGSFYLQMVLLLFGSITGGAGIIPISIFFFAVVSLWTLSAYQAAQIMESVHTEHLS